MGGVELAELPDETVPIDLGHRDVAEDDVEPRLLDGAQRLRRRRRRHHRRTEHAEDLGGGLADRRLIIDDQDAHSIELRRAKAEGGPRGGARGDDAGGQEREHHPEGRPVPLAGALGAHGAAVEIDDVADDGQTQAEPAELPRRRRVLLREAIEDVRQERGLDAAPLVAHPQRRAITDGGEAHRDAARPSG